MDQELLFLNGISPSVFVFVFVSYQGPPSCRALHGSYLILYLFLYLSLTTHWSSANLHDLIGIKWEKWRWNALASRWFGVNGHGEGNLNFFLQQKTKLEPKDNWWRMQPAKCVLLFIILSLFLCATLIFIFLPKTPCCVIYVKSVQMIYVAGVNIRGSYFPQVTTSTIFWRWQRRRKKGNRCKNYDLGENLKRRLRVWGQWSLWWRPIESVSRWPHFFHRSIT